MILCIPKSFSINIKKTELFEIVFLAKRSVLRVLQIVTVLILVTYLLDLSWNSFINYLLYAILVNFYPNLTFYDLKRSHCKMK